MPPLASGPESAARDAEKQIPGTAVPPSAAASGPCPNSVLRWVEAAADRAAAADITAAARSVPVAERMNFF